MMSNPLTSRSATTLRSHNYNTSSKIYANSGAHHHHQQQPHHHHHNHHQHRNHTLQPQLIHPIVRDSKQMFLNRELPPIPGTGKRFHEPLPPPPPPPTSAPVSSKRGLDVWTIPSLSELGSAYANIANISATSEGNYYSVTNYGSSTYSRPHNGSNSYKSDDIYDSNHGAYATSTISTTTGLENPAFYSDVDLTNIIRKAVYMSSSAEGNKNLNHNQQQPPKHHQLLHQLPAHPQPSYPLVLPNNSFAVNQNAQRLRNEIIASAATLPSLHNSTGGSKSPLKRFWEFKLNDPDSDCAIGHTNSKIKSKTFCWCLAAVVMCLAIVVIGVSAFTYFMVNKNLNLWDESATSGENNKLSNIESEFLENQQKDERLERGSKIILGEFTLSNRQYSTALSDVSTPEFETLASDVVKSMDEMFLESPLAKIYNLTQVYEFSESNAGAGVVVKCRISLNIVLLTAAQEVGLTFINALERRHGRLPAGNLRVDITTIKFTALSTATASAPAPNASAPEVAGSPAPSPPLMPNGYRPVMVNTGNGLATDSPIASVVQGSHDGRDGKPDSAITTGREVDSKRLVNERHDNDEDVVVVDRDVVNVGDNERVGASGGDGTAFWSNWSEWSPCRGLNNKCDSGRIHSRIRKCLAHNGDVLNSDICRVSHSEQQELEIRDCRCDATDSSAEYKPNSTSSTNETSQHIGGEQTPGACNGCNQNEICLLQVKAAVPFCAKIKDPRDPRGCGGWCSGHKELCRYVATNTYQCVDDSECLEGEWQCANGLCIPESRRCDGHFNCFDMSDETHCSCKEDEFHCGNKTSCLPISQRCDGIIHCWDGEDEQNCTKLCSENQFTCNSGQCIPIESFCDTHKHCTDGSDEPDGCSAGTVCKSHEYQCKNGRCLSSRSAVCDGTDNCGDGSDEIDCKHASNHTSQLTRQDGTPGATAINN